MGISLLKVVGYGENHIWGNMTHTAAVDLMGRLDLDISDELEQKFRAKVYQRKGMKKGNLTDSLKEAIILWMGTESFTEGKKTK